MLRSMLFLLFLSLSTICSSEEKSEKSFKRKTVCLNMIVKNEKDVIVRCLQSVLPIIDTWVIVDTGSSDGTQKIIEDFMREKNIPGKLYEQSWVNFGHNRNQALALAKDQADYILFMDADDYLVISEKFQAQELTADCYVTATRNLGLDSYIPRLVKASLPWRWEGVIHEYITADNVQGCPWEGVQYVYTHDGARSKDSDTAMRDLKLLQSDPTPRNVFYTILTYLQMQKYEDALASCEQRIQMQGLEEELFVAYLIKGTLEKSRTGNMKEAKKSFLTAYKLRPHRLEPLYYLGELLWQEKDYETGYELMSAIQFIPHEHSDILFVERWIYDYGVFMQYALFAAQTGRFAEGWQATSKVLSCVSLSEEHKKDMERCKAYIKDRKLEEMQLKLQKIIATSN